MISMQNFLITLVLFLFSLFVSAQEVPEKFTLDKGTWSLGGSLSIGGAHANNNDQFSANQYDNFSFNVRPDIGYFFADNFQAGAQLGYGFSKSSFERATIDENRNNSLAFSPYLRKFFSLGSKFAISLTGSLEYSIHQTDEYTDDIHVGQRRSESYGVSAQPGIFFLLNEKVSLNANIGSLYYTHSKDSRDGEDTQFYNQYGLNASLNNVWLGIRYYIN